MPIIVALGPKGQVKGIRVRADVPEGDFRTLFVQAQRDTDLSGEGWCVPLNIVPQAAMFIANPDMLSNVTEGNAGIDFCRYGNMDFDGS